jgi:hypothetical protein
MSQPNLDRFHQPSGLSMIGGAAQGGSTKTQQERERLDREHGEEPQGPAGAGGTPREGTAGGKPDDKGTPEQRSDTPRSP